MSRITLSVPRVAGLVWMLCAASAALAHHSFAMFEMSKNVTYKGTVVEYHLENPHSHIIIEVPASEGKDLTGRWDIEGGAVNIMVKQGWTKTTYKPGDPVTVVGHPMKDGSKAASLFYAILPDGKRLYHDIARPNADGSAPPPR
ncbi:MAG TPA: DUF6152 family protein [Bryobacteraceae bacterium]